MEINEIGNRKPTEKKLTNPKVESLKRSTHLINKPLAKLTKSKKKEDSNN